MCERFFLAVGLTALLVSCQPFSFDTLTGRTRRGSGRGENPPRDTTATGGGEQPPELRYETAVYVCGVEFPEGYDWLRDTAYRSGERTLVLMRNGVRVLELPAGAERETGADPDMHRILEGKLYSDWSTAGETVIRCNGEELLRFTGRESIISFRLWDGHIHTLGRDRDGQGFSYRVDGKTLFRKEKGEAVGELHRDGDAVCFGYYDGGGYIVVDGKETALPLPQGIAGLYDIRRRDGTVEVAMRTGAVSGTPLLRLGEVVTQLPRPYYIHHFSRCRFVSGSDRPLLKLSYIRTGDSRQDALWDRSSPLEMLPMKARALDWYVGEEGIGYVAVTEDRALIRPPGGTQSELPGRYSFYTEACGGLFDGNLYAVLTGLDGTQSVLWKDGMAEPVALRGYLSGVYVREEVVQSSQ